MIIVTRPQVTDAEIDHIRERIESIGMRTHLSRGEQRTIIGCIGDESLRCQLRPIGAGTRRSAPALPAVVVGRSAVAVTPTPR